MISRRRSDPRFRQLVNRAERLLKTHGTPASLSYPHLVSSLVVDNEFYLELRRDGKLDVELLTGESSVHVLRRYKNHRGWFNEEFIDQTMTLIARHMVLDDLADI